MLFRSIHCTFPVAVLALAGGLLFGLWKGAVYTFIGAVLNCSLMFWMSRNLCRKQIEALIRKKLSIPWQNRLARLGTGWISITDHSAADPGGSL